jgi:hypothetical protein
MNEEISFWRNNKIWNEIKECQRDDAIDDLRIENNPWQAFFQNCRMFLIEAKDEKNQEPDNKKECEWNGVCIPESLIRESAIADQECEPERNIKDEEISEKQNKSLKTVDAFEYHGSIKYAIGTYLEQV